MKEKFYRKTEMKLNEEMNKQIAMKICSMFSLPAFFFSSMPLLLLIFIRLKFP
jgi:hypothetical protein